MAITYGNVDNWLKKSNVKGFALNRLSDARETLHLQPETYRRRQSCRCLPDQAGVGHRASVARRGAGSGGHSHVQQEIACSRRKGPHDRLVRRSRRGLSRPIVTANESKGCVSSPVPCVCHRTYQTARVLLQRRAPAYDVRRIGERCRDQRRRDSERQCEGYKRGRPPRRDR